jgi:polynucleotide 5'-hydroxyl-kinase GRC3/NOL9
MLSPNNTLIIRGPASLQLLDGEASVLGAPLKQNCKFVVRPEKQLPVETESEAYLEILLGQAAEIFEIEGSTIPESWRTAAEALAEMETGKVVVIGATDAGKSTLCTYLVNHLLQRKLSLHVVDADIGQADIGPPTTIGSSAPTGFISSLVDLRSELLIFIGHTSPGQVESKLVDGIRRLSNRRQEFLTIINTDGWVLEPEAILYKIKLIDAIEPDLVLGIATGTELQPILSGSRARSMNVEASAEVLARSRSDRREIRVAGYRRFLEGGRTRSVALQRVNVRVPRRFPPLQAPQSREFKNLIVGLLDSQGYLLQIGVLTGLEKEVLRVYSRPVEGLREIEIGFIKLSTDGTELGYFDM